MFRSFIATLDAAAKEAHRKKQQQQQEKTSPSTTETTATTDSTSESVPGPSTAVDDDIASVADLESMDNDSVLRKRRLEKFSQPVKTIEANDDTSPTSDS